MRWEAWVIVVIMVFESLAYIGRADRPRAAKTAVEIAAGLAEYFTLIVLAIRLGGY